ncbi:MAG: hypothetical protein SVR04_16980, partial [Spirochaetota bacterium]|nr:hypothetical protein [Spirochaetota bacterium]
MKRRLVLKLSLFIWTGIFLISGLFAQVDALPLNGELQENQVCLLERQDSGVIAGGAVVEAMSVWPRTSSDFFQSREHGDPLLRLRNGILELYIQTHTWSGWIRADQAAVDGISNGAVYIGQMLSRGRSGQDSVSMQPSHYIQTESRVVMIDLEAGKIIESRILEEPTDYISLCPSELSGYMHDVLRHNRPALKD